MYPLTNCKTCNSNCSFNKGYEGNLDTADILILNDAPSLVEEQSGSLFSSDGNILLKDKLKKFNFPFDRTVISNVCLCYPLNGKAPSTLQVKSCKVNLDYLIQKINPKFIIVLGNIPLKSLTKKTGITKYNGTILEVDDIKILPLYSPSYVLRNRNKKISEVSQIEGIWESDIRFICKTVKNEEIKKIEKSYYLLETLKEVEEAIKQIKKNKKVAVDIETTGLYFWRNKIRSIQFSIADHQGFYLPLLEHLEYIKFEDPVEAEDLNEDLQIRKTGLYYYWTDEELIKLKKLLLDGIFLNPNIFITGQNFKFDHKFLDYYFFKKDYSKSISNIVFDTMFALYLSDENTPNDLKTNVYFHFEDLRGYAQVLKGKLSNKNEEESDFTKIKLPDLLMYGLGDVEGTYRLADLYSNKLNDNQLKWMYDFYMKLHYIYERGERIGVGVDREQVNKVKKKYQEEMLKIETEICKIANKPDNQSIREKVKKDNPTKTEKQIIAIWKKKIFNLNSSKQLAKVLFEEMNLPIIKRTDTGAPSTNAEVLKELALDNPFCRTIVSYKNRVKMISTYLDGTIKYGDASGTIVPGFPMVHFNTGLVSTVTGRSCLTGDTMILTDHGEIPIAQIIGTLEPGWNKIEPILVQTKEGFKEVTKGFVLKPTKTIILELEDGTQLEGSPDHQLIIDDKKVKLSELSVNDFIEKIID